MNPSSPNATSKQQVHQKFTENFGEWFFDLNPEKLAE